jgi:Flp pilus assembly protein TadB
MSRYKVTDVLKFLAALVLVQSATAIQVAVALRSDSIEVWMLLAMLALSLSLGAALWFASMVGHARTDAISRVKETYLREREQIKIRAEREKAKVVKQSHDKIIKDRNRTQTQANVKVGAALAGVAALGAVMLLTQFVTIGFLTLTAAGGAFAGYAVRARQDYLGRRSGQDSVGRRAAVKLLPSLGRKRT